MQHRSSHKLQRAFADGNGISGFNQFIFPAGGVEVSFQSLFPGAVGDYFSLRSKLHNIRNVAGMVHFNVIYHNIGDF